MVTFALYITHMQKGVKMYCDKGGQNPFYENLKQSNGIFLNIAFNI